MFSSVAQRGTSQGFLSYPPEELDLDRVLASGQSFRWKRDECGWWMGVIGRPPQIVRVRRNGAHLEFEAGSENGAEIVHEYFRLNTLLAHLFDRWDCSGDAGHVFHRYPGLRLLRQDPVECLFSFICSSAAPIHRIRRSVAGLCERYGEPIGNVLGRTEYSFPEPEVLASVQRLDLDRLGLGFRGRYIPAAAEMLLSRGGSQWLSSLRSASYEEAHLSLTSLPGVGAKVADCVCLFALDKDSAVPIDVHMARVMQRLFPELVSLNSLTRASYLVAAAAFRDRFGSHAGWAQQYFFFGEISARGLWDSELNKHRPRS